MTEHNDDFDRSLTERLRAHESRVPGGAAPDLDGIGSVASSRRRTGWGWGALVAGGGVVAGLILVLVFNGRPSPPTGQATATPGPTTSSSPAATASPTPSALEKLSIVPVVGLAAGDELRAITQVDGRLIGVGGIHNQEFGLGAVWTSLDGATWTLAPNLPAELPPPAGFGTSMTSIARGPAGLVAIGSWQGFDFSTPRVWYSATGQQWTSVYGPSDPGIGAYEGMNALVAGGPGYVAVGHWSDNGLRVQLRAWSSADGRAWTVVGNQAVTGSLDDVVGGGGTLVAVGSNGTGALAFVSADGATWTAAPQQEALQGAEMTSVTFRNGTLVAAGLLGPMQADLATPAIWRSSDGLHWTLVLRGEPGQRINQAVSTDAGFVAIGGRFPSAGWTYDPAAPNPPRDTILLWFSVDGKVWSGPTTGFLADGGVTLGRATVSGGDLLVPIILLNPGPSGPVSEGAILRGPLRTTS